MEDKHTEQSVRGESDWKVSQPLNISHPTTRLGGAGANKVTLKGLLQTPTDVSVC